MSIEAARSGAKRRHAAGLKARPTFQRGASELPLPVLGERAGERGDASSVRVRSSDGERASPLPSPLPEYRERESRASMPVRLNFVGWARPTTLGPDAKTVGRAHPTDHSKTTFHTTARLVADVISTRTPSDFDWSLISTPAARSSSLTASDAIFREPATRRSS